MKPHRDASALAARLGAAANTPIPLPQRTPQQTMPAVVVVPDPEPQPEKPSRAAIARSKAEKAPIATRAITLRLSADLLNKYVMAAAERTRETGRVVSAQEIMLAKLGRGP
jgi:uncharacterized protein (DUF4415 family)